MAEPQTHVTVTDSDGVKVVSFSDRQILDELSISEIRDELTKLVASHDQIKLLLSFKNVEHLSSAALGVRILRNKQVGERGGQLRLSDINPQIFEVFKITRLDKLLDIRATAGEALNSF